MHIIVFHVHASVLLKPIIKKKLYWAKVGNLLRLHFYDFFSEVLPDVIYKHTIGYGLPVYLFD